MTRVDGHADFVLREALRDDWIEPNDAEFLSTNVLIRMIERGLKFRATKDESRKDLLKRGDDVHQ